jgi:branched-chain amino acid transport system ATP-binding protein
VSDASTVEVPTNVPAVPVLQARGLEAGYEGLSILHGVDLEVRRGEVTAIIGANGAGKTTLLRVLSGILAPTAGTVMMGAEDVTQLEAHAMVRRGLVMVAEDRELFGEMSVAENLRMGAYTSRDGFEARLAEVEELFPILVERRTQLAHTMSGGQQQMVAIGRALMAGPQILLLDEPSLGLAPILVRDVFAAVQRIQATGVTVVLVEQNASQALGLADHAIVLESGEVVATGSGAELKDDPRVRAAYLGTS